MSQQEQVSQPSASLRRNEDSIPSQSRLPEIIGFAGLIGSGKSTAAGILWTEYFYTRTPFAQQIKFIVDDLFQIDTLRAVRDREYKEAVLPQWGKSPRELYQLMGTEVGRHLHPDVWIEYVFRKKERLGVSHIVIEDVRYPNAVKAIQDRGGVVIYVNRPGIAQDSHPSEQLDSNLCDFIIDNRSTREVFETQVRKALLRLRGQLNASI